MIDATHLKAHRTAASLLKKGVYSLSVTLYTKIIDDQLSEPKAGTVVLGFFMPDESDRCPNFVKCKG